jgi:hypothetical protein
MYLKKLHENKNVHFHEMLLHTIYILVAEYINYLNGWMQYI